MKASKIINIDKLFWGSSLLNGIITPSEKEELSNKELLSWLSFLYWGESFAMRYASIMLENSKDKGVWSKIYEEEFKHKAMISSYFLEHKVVPEKMNNFLKNAHKVLDEFESSEGPTNEKKITIIQDIQLFLEEALFITIKYRLPFIIDRTLKSILNIIMMDEAKHIAQGKKELAELSFKAKKLTSLSNEEKRVLFPLHLSKYLLKDKVILNVEERIDAIINELLCDGRSISDKNFPLPILKKFKKIPEYNCVACCPTRHDGLHLQPKFDKDIVYDTYRFPRRCEGFDGIVHGGFVAMILDEMSCYAPILQNKKLPLTMSLNITYKKPIRVLDEYKVSASIIKVDGQVFEVESQIENSSGVLASATAKLYIPSRDKAHIILGNMANSSIVQELLYDS